MRADLDFACTSCGKCCQNLKVPLSVTEAIDWLTDGHEVQIICEAAPWPVEPSTYDLPAAYRQRRSFATMSGSLPARVTVILAATFNGPCPYLQPDMRCGIYQERPLVCRIYPAEINPFFNLLTANKQCPEEAWNGAGPPLLRQGIIVDANMRDLIRQVHDINANDVRTKERLCAALHLNVTALANEGFVVHSPERNLLLTELRRADNAAEQLIPPTIWRFISNQRASVDTLTAIGALTALVAESDELPFQYLGFQPACP